MFPCIVSIKYVYGVVPKGVHRPNNAAINIIKIKYFTFLFLSIFILYGCFLLFSLLCFIFSLCNSNCSIFSSNILTFSGFLKNIFFLIRLTSVFIFNIKSKSTTTQIKYSAIYGKNKTKKNGHTATCKLAINNDISNNPTAYPIFLFRKNLSIKNISNINKIKVTNCALAAI